MQFIKFGLVGISNTLIALGVYWICFYVLHIHYQLSNLIAFVISVTNAFYWNSKYVFGQGSNRTVKEYLKAYIKAFVSYGGTYLLGAALLYLWVEVLHISEGLAPAINILITIPLNFLLNKYFAFRKTEPKTTSRRDNLEKFSLLGCTIQDGGYINDLEFGQNTRIPAPRWRGACWTAIRHDHYSVGIQ